MKTKILYIFIFLFSLTVLPYCKSSPEDTGKNSGGNTEDGQPTDDNKETSSVNLEAPKMSDIPALLQLDPPVPLLQEEILPAIPNNLNDSIIEIIRLYYKCKDEKEKEGEELNFQFTESYNPDITLNWGNTLCKIEKIHEEDSSPVKYIKSETDRYHCRKELSKIISSRQEAGYRCYVTSLYVGIENKRNLIRIFW